MTYQPASYNCYFCEKCFDKEQEIYTIRNLFLQYDGTEENRLRWRWMKPTDNVENVDLYFHRDCFLAVAGEVYVGKIKNA